MNNLEIKNQAKYLGADLCGIASVSRFDGAPEGFHPTDVLSGSKSVIVVACRIPKTSLYTTSKIPYSTAEELAFQEISRITYKLSLFLEDNKIGAVPIVSIPYDYWDSDKMEGRGLLSFRHAGKLAGLGVFGKNSLLYNDKYGSLIKLGIILSRTEFEQDELDTTNFCKDSCNLCVKACPVGAIENNQVIQKLCRPHSEIKNKRGAEITACNECRTICPFVGGYKKNKN